MKQTFKAVSLWQPDKHLLYWLPVGCCHSRVGSLLQTLTNRLLIQVHF